MTKVDGTILIGFSLLIHFWLFFICEHQALSDAQSYLENASAISNGDSYTATHYVFYSTHIFWLAFFKVISLGHFQIMIALQVLAYTLALLYCGFRLAAKCQSRILGFVFIGFHLSSIHFLHWNLTTMSESTFAILVLFLIVSLLNFNFKFLPIFKLTILLLLLLFSRPTSVVFVFGTLIFILFSIKDIYQIQLPKLVSGFTIGFVGLLMIGVAFFLFEFWDFTEAWNNGNVITFAHKVAGSSFWSPSLQIKPDHPVYGEDWVVFRMLQFIKENPIQFVKMAGLKVFYLFSFIRPYYSLTHNLFLGLFTFVIYFLAIIGWQSKKKETKLLFSFPYKIFFLLIILLTTIIICLSTVDWDNRFFLPMHSVIILYASVGFKKLLTI